MKGKEIQSDLQLLATGVILTTDYLKSFHDGKLLDDRKQVKVNSFLQTEEAKNIFAIGDLNNVPAAKQFYGATVQAELLAKNLAKAVKDGKISPVDTGSFKAYSPGPSALFLALGPKHGLGQLGSMTMGHFLVKIMKSSHLFASKTWTAVGYKSMPK